MQFATLVISSRKARSSAHHLIYYMAAPSAPTLTDLDKLGLATALAKARKSYQEGGIPIGAALVYHGDPANPKPNASSAAVLGCAHNQRIQKSSPTLHAEIAALEDAGRQRAGVYRNSTMVRSFPCSPPRFHTHSHLYDDDGLRSTRR